jgi:hypothetical protein
MSDMPAPVQINRLTANSFEAFQDGYRPFVVRETRDGWKTEGHPVHDGLLFTSLDDVLARLEGRS